MSTPRVGVIGAGSLGYHHVRLLRDMPNAEFAGFYDIDATRAAAVQAELGAIAAPSLTALLDRVDAVTVVVPCRLLIGPLRTMFEFDATLTVEAPPPLKEMPIAYDALTVFVIVSVRLS